METIINISEDELAECIAHYVASKYKPEINDSDEDFARIKCNRLLRNVILHKWEYITHD